MGEHSKYGRIWHVRSLGLPLVTEYGAVGPECDCAEAWLRKLPPTTTLEASNDALYLPATPDGVERFAEARAA